MRIGLSTQYRPALSFLRWHQIVTEYIHLRPNNRLVVGTAYFVSGSDGW